jgi:hypothetical protein
MTNQSSRPAGGFQGATGGLPLVDLLQVWSMNRFSGLVAVTYVGHVGHLYFVEGEIIHAEAGAVAGEAAVGEILGWPGGAFEQIPNTTTLKRTISKKLSHLLLDAHRIMDERRRQPEPALTPPPISPAGEAGGPSRVDRIRALAGVTRVVRFGRDGRTAAGEGPAAEELAAKGLYLAINHAGAVAATFGLRDVVVATVQGARESFLIVHSNGNYLAVAVSPGVALEPVAAQVRSLLTRPAGR